VLRYFSELSVEEIAVVTTARRDIGVQLLRARALLRTVWRCARDRSRGELLDEATLRRALRFEADERRRLRSRRDRGGRRQRRASSWSRRSRRSLGVFGAVAVWSAIAILRPAPLTDALESDLGARARRGARERIADLVRSRRFL